MSITEIKILDWLAAICVTGGSIFVLGIAKKFIKPKLRGLFDHKSGYIFVESLNGPINVILVYTSVILGLQFAPHQIHRLPEILVAQKVVFIALFMWSLSRIATAFLSSAFFPSNVSSSGRKMTSIVVHIALLSMLALLTLDTLGISITPILASLGVGSLAVALALQDTLNNFFSGIYIFIDKPFRIGDSISLDGGKEGVVESIGWRSTRIMLSSDDVLVVPNSKLSSAIITNHDFPHNETIAAVEALVTYKSDLNKVEALALEVANEVQNSVPGGVSDHAPKVRFHTFADIGIKFTIVMRAKHIKEQGLLQSEFLKRLHTRFKSEGIDIR